MSKPFFHGKKTPKIMTALYRLKEKCGRFQRRFLICNAFVAE